MAKRHRYEILAIAVLSVRFLVIPIHKISAQTHVSPEVWFGSASRHSTAEQPRPRAVDLMDMFKPDARCKTRRPTFKFSESRPISFIVLIRKAIKTKSTPSLQI